MNLPPHETPAPAIRVVPYPPDQPTATGKRSRMFFLGLGGIIAGGIGCLLSVVALVLFGILSQHAVTPMGALGLIGLAAGGIGALLAAAGLAAILIDRRNNVSKQPAEPSGLGPPEAGSAQIHYTLQTNTSSVEVRPNVPAPVYFQALRIPPEGEPVIAPEATIQVIVTETPAGLAASPTTGTGSLECTFSIPTPKVCENLTVVAIAMVGEQVKARAYVHVYILPVYKLELEWEDSSQAALQADGKEVRAWARVTASPPDPETPPDRLVKKIDVRVQGPNSAWIRQPLKPSIQEGKQWNPISAVRPEAEAELQPGNPELVANFSAGGQQLVARLPVELNRDVVQGPDQ